MHLTKGKLTRFPFRFLSPREREKESHFGVSGPIPYDLRSCQQSFFTMENREVEEADLKIENKTDKQQESKGLEERGEGFKK